MAWSKKIINLTSRFLPSIDQANLTSKRAYSQQYSLDVFGLSTTYCLRLIQFKYLEITSKRIKKIFLFILPVPASPTPTECTQLLLACYRLHCTLRSGRGNERQLHLFRFLCSSRQADCARKNTQQKDLYVL